MKLRIRQILGVPEIVITWELLLCLIRMPLGFWHTYQAKHSCPCYNLYLKMHSRCNTVNICIMGKFSGADPDHLVLLGVNIFYKNSRNYNLLLLPSEAMHQSFVL